MGDLFHYEIENAVTVKRSQSALVPILQSTFEGERVAIYNRAVREKNPMSAVRFKNTTGMTLEGGTVTVLEDGSYVGESMLETLKPDEERLLPFSVELGCKINVDHESRLEEVHFVRITKGRLTLHQYRVERTVYLVTSKLDKELTLYLDHPRLKTWKLVDTAEPKDRTESFYRFLLTVPAGETVRFGAAEQGDEVQSWQLRAIDRSQIALWVKNGYVDEATKAALKELEGQTAKISERANWMDQRENDIERIVADQQRLRENLSALGTSPDEQQLRDRYIQTMGVQEDQLVGLKEQVAGWRAESQEAQVAIDTMIRNLNVSTTI